MNWSANWYLVAAVACIISVRTYNSRPDEPGSPRWGYQRRKPCCHQNVSLRRHGLGLSNTYSRSGERCSPRRDGVEVAHVERDFSSKRGVYGFWANQSLAQARWPRLSEMSWSCLVLRVYFSPGEFELCFWARDGLA